MDFVTIIMENIYTVQQKVDKLNILVAGEMEKKMTKKDKVNFI